MLSSVFRLDGHWHDRNWKMAPATKIWVFWRVLSRLFAWIFRHRGKPPFLVNRNFLAYSPPHKQLGTGINMTHDSVKISFKLVLNYSLPDLNLEQAGTTAVILCISSIPLCINAQISITTATRTKCYLHVVTTQHFILCTKCKIMQQCPCRSRLGLSVRIRYSFST